MRNFSRALVDPTDRKVELIERFFWWSFVKDRVINYPHSCLFTSLLYFHLTPIPLELI